MTTLEIATLLVGALALAFNVHFWHRAVQGYWSWRRGQARRPDPRLWPRSRVFVCLKGSMPRLAETVRALDAQDYPGAFGITFVTEGSADGGDEAARALREILPATAHCDHVIAGHVLEHDARCAQKNWNLLAGIRHAERTHPGIEVYAFCDGDLLVRPYWLREMVKPLATGAGQVSTSFHCVEPEGRRILAALHGIAEACQSMAALVCRGAAWGGSMAILASVFRRHRLEEIWSRTVVDDMTLSRVLQRTRLTVVPVPRFLVSSRSEISGYRNFVRWLGRQYFFVRVYLPTMYRALGVKVALDVATLWLAAYHCAHAFWHGEWPAGALAGIGVTAVAASLLATFWWFRFLLPERPSVRAWLPASLLVPGASLLACADATFRRRRLIWRDLTYDVDRRGDVSRVYATKPGRPVPPVDPDPVPEEAAA